MPDVKVSLSAVRAEHDRARRRLDDLDRERAAVALECERLSIAVEVMEHHAGEVPPPSSSDGSAEALTFTGRVLGAIVEAGVVTRADLRHRFRSDGVNSNTLDSAIYRLVRKGSVRRDGRQLLPAEKSTVAAAVGPSSRSEIRVSRTDDPSGDLVLGAVETDRGSEPSYQGSSAVEVRSGEPAPVVPLTARVLEAVGSSTGCTRRVLVRQFAAQGVKEGSVDTALAGLCRRGRLERRADGTYVVSATEAVSGSADPPGT